MDKPMSKHTPGPWKLSHTRIQGFRVSDSTGWGVAVVLKDTNDEANARLIAAAPQMLEALEAVAPFLHWLDQEQGIHLAGDMLHGNILAVIKAAKGEI